MSMSDNYIPGAKINLVKVPTYLHKIYEKVIYQHILPCLCETITFFRLKIAWSKYVEFKQRLSIGSDFSLP